MDRLNKTYLLWIFAVVITLGSVVYQRMTGPSYPVRVSQTLPTGEIVKAKFLTTYESVSDAPVRVVVTNHDYSGRLEWRRINSHDNLYIIHLSRIGDTLTAALPMHPPPGAQ